MLLCLRVESLPVVSDSRREVGLVALDDHRHFASLHDVRDFALLPDAAGRPAAGGQRL
jgi:hypothetical protein